jgi:hypothetical protein
MHTNRDEQEGFVLLRGSIDIRAVLFALLCIAPFLCGATAGAEESQWLLPRGPADPWIWGFRDGIVLAVWPAALGSRGGSGGPRGLVRVGYHRNGVAQLVNFIAIEPVDREGRRGFSELEPSPRDGQQGLFFGVVPTTGTPGAWRTRLTSSSLTVVFRTDRFANGAMIAVAARFHAAHPDEVEFTVGATSESVALRSCILTATMGNYIRARELWLADGKIKAADLFPDYRGDGFAPDRFFGLDRLARDREGNVVVPTTSDEPDPAATRPQAQPWWWYRGEPVTQYWKKPKGTWRDDLRVRVNGRYCYWQSRDPLPGGVAFENFELNERYRPGQVFIFGITRRSPQELLASSPLSLSASCAFAIHVGSHNVQNKPNYRM